MNDAGSGAELARLTHDGWVNAVVFSADGARAATAGGDGTARVWAVLVVDLLAQALARLTRKSDRRGMAALPSG
jgi:WD40 repeat protein